MNDNLHRLSTHLLAACRTNKLKIATAESCTGGMIIANLTGIPGSSDVVECGFITYSNTSKYKLLGVPIEIISNYGAVSEQVVRLMAEGALQRSLASITVAVSGIAGPGGGSVHKPVGLVHLAIAQRNRKTLHQEHKYSVPDRQELRQLIVKDALKFLLQSAQEI